MDLSNHLDMHPSSTTVSKVFSMRLTFYRGYIGAFDDLTIEEIRAHPNVVLSGPRAGGCLY